MGSTTTSAGRIWTNPQGRAATAPRDPQTPDPNRVRARQRLAPALLNIEKRKAVKNLPAGTVLQYGDNRFIVEGPCSWVKTRTLVWGPEGRRWIMKRSQILASTIVSQPEPANA